VGCSPAEPTSVSIEHSKKLNKSLYLQTVKKGIHVQIDHHVDEGKEHFNIDAWNTYSRKQQKHKIEECIEVIEEGEMPMKGYVKMHERANLTDLQKKEITLWAKGLIDSMGRRN
jgi:hypothetical protein